jgi:hypothetical protein
MAPAGCEQERVIATPAPVAGVRVGGVIMTRKILIQLDCDPQPSTFDSIVAIDAEVDVLLRHGNVTPDAVVSLVHGAMFTRGGPELAPPRAPPWWLPVGTCRSAIRPPLPRFAPWSSAAPVPWDSVSPGCSSAREPR